MQFRQDLWWYWTPVAGARIDGVLWATAEEVFVFSRDPRAALAGTKFGGSWMSYRTEPKAPTRYLTPREVLAALRGSAT